MHGENSTDIRLKKTLIFITLFCFNFFVNHDGLFHRLSLLYGPDAREDVGDGCLATLLEGSGRLLDAPLFHTQVGDIGIYLKKKMQMTRLMQCFQPGGYITQLLRSQEGANDWLWKAER